MSKAYDRIEWNFLRRVLIKMGFDSSFVHTIMLCITTLWYSFLLSSKHFRALQPARGLRQGDPQSPYLFICYVEAFIRMVEASVSHDRLHGVRVAPTAPIVSNLCFADDTMLFCQASIRKADEVLLLLKKYAQASGQLINLEKSSMIFSPGTSLAERSFIQGLLGIQVVDKFDKYLRMPTMGGHSKKEVFSFLKDRVWDRISGWHERKFSMAGREVLIKAVLQAILTYVMSCFLLLTTLIHDVEKLRRYWWGGNDTRFMNWLPWSALCRSKKNGGMGFQNLKFFNLALLAKQGWHLIVSPDLLLSRFLKARYFPRGLFFTADVGDRALATWCGILKARGCLLQRLHMRIGNGLNTSIWGNYWPRAVVW